MRRRSGYEGKKKAISFYNIERNCQEISKRTIISREIREEEKEGGRGDDEQEIRKTKETGVKRLLIMISRR